MEISNNLIKWVHSLSKKKIRDEEHCFVAEGSKCVLDTLGSFRLRYLFANRQWIDQNPKVLKHPLYPSTDAQLTRMSSLKTPQNVIAVYEMPQTPVVQPVADELAIVLAGIQDPGNLGTIVRMADWYGVHSIFCSNDTVDIYNPKTIQATMGAIARVRVAYCNLNQLLGNTKMPVYGTFLNGSNIYKEKLTKAGLIVMGNEGKGVPQSLEKYMTHRLLIPSYPPGAETSESLNVAVATAIVLSEFRRPLL